MLKDLRRRDVKQSLYPTACPKCISQIPKSRQEHRNSLRDHTNCILKGIRDLPEYVDAIKNGGVVSGLFAYGKKQLEDTSPICKTKSELGCEVTDEARPSCPPCPAWKRV